MKKIAVLIAIALSTYLALDSQAACPELSAAEADVMVAQSIRFQCMDPNECRIADEYLVSALDRLASARVICRDVGDATPFEVVR